MFFFKFVFNECQLMSLPDIDIWDTLVIQLGKIMDDARWTIETYSTTRVKICENIILCLQPLLHFACCIGINNIFLFITKIKVIGCL